MNPYFKDGALNREGRPKPTVSKFKHGPKQTFNYDVPKSPEQMAQVKKEKKING